MGPNEADLGIVKEDRSADILKDLLCSGRKLSHPMTDSSHFLAADMEK